MIGAQVCFGPALVRHELWTSHDERPQMGVNSIASCRVTHLLCRVDLCGLWDVGPLVLTGCANLVDTGGKWNTEAVESWDVSASRNSVQVSATWGRALPRTCVRFPRIKPAHITTTSLSLTSANCSLTHDMLSSSTWYTENRDSSRESTLLQSVRSVPKMNCCRVKSLVRTVSRQIVCAEILRLCKQHQRLF